MPQSVARKSASPAGGAGKSSGKNREKIIEATLRIVIRDGMRGVRHRAVAQEAGVPLGSTTYHFKSIDDLISSSFEHWREEALKISDPFSAESERILSKIKEGEAYDLRVVLDELRRTLKKYLLGQIVEGRDNRIIELAFYHEALYCERLRQTVERYWASELKGLSRIHESLGSKSPKQDAELTLALLHQIERFSVVKNSPSDSVRRLDATLTHYFNLLYADLAAKR